MPESDQYISSIVSDEEVFRLKAKRDWDNCINTAEEKGEAKEKKATIRRLLASGASVDIIAVATGLTQDEVKPLIEEITKE